MRTFFVLAIFCQLDILLASTEDRQCLRKKIKHLSNATLSNRCTLSRTARQVLTKTKRKNKTKRHAEAKPPTIGDYNGLFKRNTADGR